MSHDRTNWAESHVTVARRSREFLVEDVLRDEQLPPEPALPRGEIPASDAKIVLAAVDAGQAIVRPACPLR